MQKVRIKSKEWYDAHKSEDGNVYDKYEGVIMNKEQSEYCDSIMTIDNVYYRGCHIFYEMFDCNLRWRKESFDELDIGEYLETELNEYGKLQVEEIIKTHKIRELVDKLEKMRIIK